MACRLDFTLYCDHGAALVACIIVLAVGPMSVVSGADRVRRRGLRYSTLILAWPSLEAASMLTAY